MSMRVSELFLLHLWVCTILSVRVDSYTQKRHIFATTKDGFTLDGKKFHVYAGEIHYFRIASCWWQDRLKKLQSAGFNTVSTAIEWATHEPKPTKYKWHGEANFTRFIELAQKLNLFVIVRAGPFIDVDRDLGGLPKWLFLRNKSPHQFRGPNIEYRHQAKKWLQVLLPKLAPQTLQNGGPIILFQIDSDLGDASACASNDWLYDLFTSHLGPTTILFTLNENLYQTIKCGHINGTIPAIRTNPLAYSGSFNGSITQLFAPLQAAFSQTPKLVELRCGTAWFWGGQRFSYDLAELELAISNIISQTSLILYMFAGGTNFDHPGFSPTIPTGMITSYDYDAPVSETGELTQLYQRIKSILNKRSKVRLGPRSKVTVGPRSKVTLGPRSKVTLGPRSKVTKVYNLNFTFVGSLLDPVVLADLHVIAVKHQQPLMFHQLNDVAVEMVLYETIVPDIPTGQTTELHSLGIHDRGYVYIDRVLVGIMNQTRHTITIKSPILSGQKVQILVESLGYRMHPIFADRKGISSDVYLNDVGLNNWTIYALSFEEFERWEYVAERIQGQGSGHYDSAIYRASFVASKSKISEPMDAIVDVSRLGKGRIFLNKYPLGQYWPQLGPQLYIYVPGCFVKPYPAVNQMLVVELYRRPRNKRSGIQGRRMKERANSGALFGNFILILISYLISYLIS